MKLVIYVYLLLQWLKILVSTIFKNIIELLVEIATDLRHDIFSTMINNGLNYFKNPTYFYLMKMICNFITSLVLDKIWKIKLSIYLQIKKLLIQ